MSSGSSRRGPLSVAPPPVPADIGIVAALPIEIAPLLDQFKNVRKYAANGQSIIEGTIAGKLVAMVTTGPGRKRAQRGAEILIAGHRPRSILSPGFCGALDLSIARYETFLPIEVVNVEGRNFPIDFQVLNLPSSIIRRGRLLTTDEVILKADQKASLRLVHQADLVDMETSAIAAYCAERGVRFASLRIVSDDAKSDLPPEILTIMGESGSYRIGAAMGAIWRRPSSLKDLLTLREQANEASERLCKAIVALLPIL